MTFYSFTHIQTHNRGKNQHLHFPAFVTDRFTSSAEFPVDLAAQIPKRWDGVWATFRLWLTDRKKDWKNEVLTHVIREGWSSRRQESESCGWK